MFSHKEVVELQNCPGEHPPVPTPTQLPLTGIAFEHTPLTHYELAKQSELSRHTSPGYLVF